ncbi:Hypothetical predicted protein [Cloeon dipterum]|uniref:Chitin-binding type-2 domain-containing protein n=1 Tax=Cloeon dipterum TaxID=197152 RepID=A0A8S1C401_9INSE|nr:Hypothetical predicted protein [Cloeon dipterum]
MKSILISVVAILSCNLVLAYPPHYNYKCWGVHCYTGHAARGVRTPVAGDCTSFCECQFGNPVWISCPPGLHFNHGIEKCDWPHKARCSAGSTTSRPYYTTDSYYYVTTPGPSTGWPYYSSPLPTYSAEFTTRTWSTENTPPSNPWTNTNDRSTPPVGENTTPGSSTAWPGQDFTTSATTP